MDKKIRRVYGIVMGFAIQIVCMYRWIPLNGKEATCLKTFFHILRTDNYRNASAAIFQDLMGNTQWPVDDMTAFGFFLFVACISIVQILGLFYIPLSFKGRGLMLCGISGLIFCVIPLFLTQMLSSFMEDPLVLVGFIGILFLTVGLTFVGCKLIEQIVEANRETAELRKRDKEFRMERKRRLKFKGQYSSLFYHIIWENCRSRWSDYVTFIIAGSMSVSFVIAGFGMWTLLKRDELNSILLNFLALSVVISVFLLVSILLFYLKNRMKGYGVLLNLGMRRMTLRLYMAVELILCILLSIVFGFLLGNGLLFGLKTILVRNLGRDVLSGNLTGRTWLMMFISIALIFLISLVFTRDNYYNPETSGIADKAIMAEPIGVKHNILSILTGGILVYAAVYFFADRKLGESLLFPGIFLLGSYLLLKSLWGILLRYRKRKNAVSYKTMLTDNYKYYRFKTTFRYMFFLSVMHCIILFVYAKDIAASLSADEPDSLFPYDYVCIADEEDMEDFQKLKENGAVKMYSYPMVRVLTPGQSVMFVNPGGSLINGQHIGISETTYRQMCEDSGKKADSLKLSADGSTIHVVYQQDTVQKAQPLSNFMMEPDPFLRIGEPEVLMITKAANIWLTYIKTEYPARKITSSESAILTGAMLQGVHENIIVFSDEYMENVLKENEKELVLLNLTSAEAAAEVRPVLDTFRKRHTEDESYDADVKVCYARSETAPRIARERAMNLEVNAFIIVLFIVTGFIMFYMKTIAQMDERRKQHTYLALIGMGPKERHRLIRDEFLSFLILPLITATIITGGFTWITLKLRMYTMSQTAAYNKVWGIFYVIYVLIQTAGIFALERYTIRKVDKE